STRRRIPARPPTRHAHPLRRLHHLAGDGGRHRLPVEGGRWPASSISPDRLRRRSRRSSRRHSTCSGAESANSVSDSLPPRRRATPVRCAALATSRATAGATVLLNTLGMMYSGPSSVLSTHDAIAWAAAIFISSLTSRARESSRPRNSPGKHRTLLIWFV